MSWNYGDFQMAYLDVYKDIDVKTDFDINNEYDLKVDIEKDIKVDLDIKTDVDLDGNSAVATGVFENISEYFTQIGNVSTHTNGYNSYADGSSVTMIDMGGYQYVNQMVNVDANAYGYDTYAEIDITSEAYDFGSLTTVISESATD